MSNDDEGQYWAQMQAEAMAAEAEAAMAAEAEYQQEMERRRSVVPVIVGGNAAPLTVGEGVVPLTVGQMSDIRCPKCGCRTLVNRRGDVWCSFVGGTNTPACDYSTKMLPQEIQKLVSEHFWELLA